jgi:monoterpene epsilon-lactone hydrolase
VARSLRGRLQEWRVPRWAARGIVRATLRPALRPRVPVQVQRLVPDLLARGVLLPSDVRVTAASLGGVPGRRVEAPGVDVSRALLYMHGGGFVSGSTRSHLPLAAALSRSAGAPVYAIDYRLAPEHPHPAAVDDALVAYEALVECVGAARAIAVGGDSAGGWLTLALALRLRDLRRPLPAALLLICPLADLTLSGASVAGGRDAVLTPEWLRATSRWYACGHDLRLPGLSPLFADLAGLPPIVMQGAGDDLLVSDAERLAERARAAGVPVDYERFEGLWHVFQTLVLREADVAVERAGRAVAALLRSPAAARSAT